MNATLDPDMLYVLFVSMQKGTSSENLPSDICMQFVRDANVYNFIQH